MTAKFEDATGRVETRRKCGRQEQADGKVYGCNGSVCKLTVNGESVAKNDEW
jgi:hypothetical protein